MKFKTLKLFSFVGLLTLLGGCPRETRAHEGGPKPKAGVEKNKRLDSYCGLHSGGMVCKIRIMVDADRNIVCYIYYKEGIACVNL